MHTVPSSTLIIHTCVTEYILEISIIILTMKNDSEISKVNDIEITMLIVYSLSIAVCKIATQLGWGWSSNMPNTIC